METLPSIMLVSVPPPSVHCAVTAASRTSVYYTRFREDIDGITSMARRKALYECSSVFLSCSPHCHRCRAAGRSLQKKNLQIRSLTVFFVKMTAVILKGREQVKGVELNPSCTKLTSLTAMAASYDKEGLCIDACSSSEPSLMSSYSQRSCQTFTPHVRDLYLNLTNNK